MTESSGEQNSSKNNPSIASIMAKLESSQSKKSLPTFRVGDTLKVHAKIREGGKERVQIFEGVVIRRHKGNAASATFTVRKVSFNIGVERTFLLHSPMIEKIEVVSIGEVRRARLYYLRNLRGKSARIKSQLVGGSDNQATIATATEAKGSSDNGSSAAPAQEETASA